MQLNEDSAARQVEGFPNGFLDICFCIGRVNRCMLYKGFTEEIRGRDLQQVFLMRDFMMEHTGDDGFDPRLFDMTQRLTDVTKLENPKPSEVRAMINACLSSWEQIKKAPKKIPSRQLTEIDPEMQALKLSMEDMTGQLPN